MFQVTLLARLDKLSNLAASAAKGCECSKGCYTLDTQRLTLLSARTFTTISKSSPILRRWCFSVKSQCLFWFGNNNKAFSRKILTFLSFLIFDRFLREKWFFLSRKLCLKIVGTSMTLMPHVRHIATCTTNQKPCRSHVTAWRDFRMFRLVVGPTNIWKISGSPHDASG